jgi:hypothetical protein
MRMKRTMLRMLPALGFTALGGGCGLVLGLDQFSEGTASGSSTGAGSGSTGGSGGMGTGSTGTGGIMCSNPMKDCPAPVNECVTAICDTMGKCATTLVADGTAVTAQTTGDCKKVVCDGAALTKSVDDDTDAPDDMNDCTINACSKGVSAPKPEVAGTACITAGGKFCDGAGACVECSDPSHCASLVCQSNNCVDASCADGVQNGSETDKDCGGAACQHCADGLGCATGTDCVSQVCDTANTKKCQAPTCSDGVRNGTEVGVDCGGSCSACGFGTGCVADSDCATGYCVGFKCDAKVLAPGQSSAYDIAVDSAFVYWCTFDQTMGTIAKVPIAEGNITTLATLQGGPRAIALDTSTSPTTVYWVNYYEKTVKKISSNGGVITTLATGTSSPRSLALTPTTVYWTNINGAVLKVPVGGGAATTIASSIAPTTGIVVSGLNVYWTAKASVWKQPLAGGATTQIYTGMGVGDLEDIVSDGSNVYFTETSNSQILATGINGGAVTVVANANTPNGIALDGTNLYWADNGNNGGIEKVATSGGAMTTIAPAQSAVSVAVDATSAYWTSNGQIKKANK